MLITHPAFKSELKGDERCPYMKLSSLSLSQEQNLTWTLEKGILHCRVGTGRKNAKPQLTVDPVIFSESEQVGSSQR
jgi:hypothetical protein